MKTKFKPILFSTPMVRAILEGSKTQTRRILKVKGCKPFIPDNTWDIDTISKWNKDHHPYGKVGDIFWVRETHKLGAWNDIDMKAAFDYKASPELTKTPWVEYTDIDRFELHHQKWINELDELGVVPSLINEQEERFYYHWEPGQSPFKWKPSIFMPKEACRIFLKINNIQIERLQDISEKDAVKEGLDWDLEAGVFRYKNYLKDSNAPTFGKAKASFASLWESINGPESWEVNPWVWVIEFEKVDKPNDFLA